MNILVLHPGALGDVLLSLPALRMLRDAFPQARVTLACTPDGMDAIAAPYADRVLSLSSLPLYRLYGPGPAPPADECFWRGWDRVLSWTGSGDGGFRRNFARLHPCTLVASWRPAAGETRHVARIFADSIRPWIGGRRELRPAAVRLKPELEASGRDWLRGEGWRPGEPILALHPGAGSVSKRWPLQNFRMLIRLLREDGEWKFLVVEGPAELGIAAQFAAGLPAGDVFAARSLPLGALAGVLGQCRAFAGNDSGIAHLAASLGLASVVLFGPASPQQWAPLGARVLCLRAPESQSSLEGIAVEDVRNGLFRLLADPSIKGNQFSRPPDTIESKS